MPDRGDEWWLVQEKTIDSLWANYAGPYETREPAVKMKARAEERRPNERYRIVHCKVDPD